MKATYTTSEIAHIVGVHPNTVRLYEELKLISKPDRKPNGYRIFTGLHVTQFRIARLAFEVEILQNGLRKQAVQIIRACAQCDFEKASKLTSSYLRHIREERRNAEQAIKYSEQILTEQKVISKNLLLTRKQAAEYLRITVDTLRNWELNGLITVKRRGNGYRVYNDSDLRRLTIIKSLRCANYSLSAILRMMTALSVQPQTNIREIIDTSEAGDVISACDHLLTSLDLAEKNAGRILEYLEELKRQEI